MVEKMAYGGGNFLTMSKKLPGAYMNFVSLATPVSADFSRGVAAMGVKLGWGPEDGIFTLTKEDMLKNSLKKLGYGYAAAELDGLRDLFLNAHTLRTYRLDGGGKKAACNLGTAKYAGTRGNRLMIAVEESEKDEGTKVFTVKTYVDGVLADKQSVEKMSELADNDWVDFKREAALTATAGMQLSGGSDGEESIEAHQKFLNLIDGYSVNAIGVASGDKAVNSLYAEYAKRMRDEVGAKLQVVLYRHAADHEGVVNVENEVVGADAASLVWWATGIVAGMQVNESAMNQVYDGCFEVKADYSQAELGEMMDSGKFCLHRVNEELRVLSDLNSLVSLSEDRGEIFRDNQVVRVADAAAEQIAQVFAKKYMGRVSNSNAGRVSLWADIVTIFRSLERCGAIEGFDEESVRVEQGPDSHSVAVEVSGVDVAGAMEKLYMTVVIQ